MITERQTPMLLSETEWDDLAHICEQWRLEHTYPGYPALTDPKQRRLALVQRIKDAAWGAP